jgi:hypothetical protein
MLVQATAQTASALFLTWLFGRKLLRFSWRDLRIKDVGPAGPGFSRGLALGAVAAVTALVLGVIMGHAAWLPDSGSLTSYLAQLGKTLVVLAPAALSEELLFRGLPLVVLARAVGLRTAIVALSIVFGLVHVTNFFVTGFPGWDLASLAIGNIALAGIFLSFAFLAPGGLWTAWGAHLGWNATLAALDAPVSGLPFRIPLIDYAPGGPVWLTGGRFGPEGGVTATIAIALASWMAWRWTRKEVVTT